MAIEKIKKQFTILNVSIQNPHENGGVAWIHRGSFLHTIARNIFSIFRLD